MSATYLAGLACLLCCTAPSLPGQSTADADFQLHYLELQRLEAKILHAGATRQDNQELKHIRDFFVASGDPGARFLLTKLEAITSEELSHLQPGKTEEDQIAEMFESVELEKQPEQVDLCMILADSYPRVKPSLQEQILQAITRAYSGSPMSSDAFDWALDVIGAPAVPFQLRLANHKMEWIRCRVSGNLAALVTDFNKQGRLRDVPPELDCKAPEEKRRAAIAAWEQWWNNEGKSLPFPKIPSLFD